MGKDPKQRDHRTIPVTALLDLTGDALAFWQFVVEGFLVPHHRAGGWIIPEEVRPGRGKAKADRDKARARQMRPLVKIGLAEKITDGWRVLPLRKEPEKQAGTDAAPVSH